MYAVLVPKSVLFVVSFISALRRFKIGLLESEVELQKCCLGNVPLAQHQDLSLYPQSPHRRPALLHHP